MKRSSSLRLRRPKPIGRSGSAVVGCWMVAISRLLSRRVLVLGRPPDGGDDVLVARAAADAAGDRGADLLLAGIRLGVEQRGGRHEHAGCAETALERVLLVEALLDRVERAVLRQRLDGADL